MRAMKDSGIDWVGPIPKEWDSIPIRAVLKEVTDKNYDGSIKNALKFTYGEIVPKTNFEADGDDYVANTIMSYTVVEPGTIMLNGLNLNFDFVSQRIGLVKNKGVITSAYIALKPSDKRITSEFAAYLLKAYDGCKAFHNMGGGIRKILNYNELKRYYVCFPTRSEQQAIVDYLDKKCAETDTLTAGIQAEIETLENYKLSVITEAVTKGLDPDAPMKDSGTPWCPQIPAHWNYTNPKALFSQRFERATHDERQLTASQEYGIVYQDEFMEMTGNRVVTVIKDFSILKHVEPGDFVISMRSFQGGLEYSELSGCISSAYVMLIPNEVLVYPPFYKWFFKSSKYINAIQSTSNLVRDGQAMRYANFVQVPLFIIPLEEQKRIADYLDEAVTEVNAIIKSKQDQLSVLADYKKSVIYEYVTGKKEVPTS